MPSAPIVVFARRTRSNGLDCVRIESYVTKTPNKDYDTHRSWTAFHERSLCVLHCIVTINDFQLLTGEMLHSRGRDELTRTSACQKHARRVSMECWPYLSRSARCSSISYAPVLLGNYVSDGSGQNEQRTHLHIHANIDTSEHDTVAANNIVP